MTEGVGDSIQVRLPGLFILFLSEEPRINPNYSCIREESETWIARECFFDEKAKRSLRLTNFSLFVSIVAPQADSDRLRTLCDWGNWVFPFDDAFDNGSLKADPIQAKKMIDSLLYNMEYGDDEKHVPVRIPLVEVHNSVWDRIVATISTDRRLSGVQRRFAKAMSDYSHGTLSQVEVAYFGKRPSLEEILNYRRDSAGVSPLFPLLEYAHKLDLPDEVFECPSIREINRIGVDFVVLQNDVLSYCKEEKEGVDHNIVAVCRNSGMPAQAAFNYVDHMLKSRYQDWYLALAQLPSWGSEVDSQVQDYIRGVQNVVKANLNWRSVLRDSEE